MAAPVVPSLIVNELLNKHNSEDWRVRVKTYLVAKGLWSVVVEATEPRLKGKDKREAWKKANAEALHAIHLCCGNDAFKVIRDEESAHKAWEALKFHYPGGPQSGDAQQEEEKADESEEEVDQGDGDGDKNSSNDDTGYKPFFRAAKHWKWKIVMDFLKDHPEAIRKPAPSDDGKTVLHYAVDAAREDIVRRLLQYIDTDDDLEIRDDQWCSALDYCYIVPEKDGTVEIAKCLLDKKKELLAGDVDPRVIRDLLVGAYIHGRSKLADYLYKVTPLKTDDPHVAHLISLSFSTKRFGIACDLIQKHPSLAIAKDNSDNSPLNELACTPSAFLSGSRLKFWEKLIYHVISIKPTPPVKSEEEPTLTMDNKGKPTPPLHAISIDVPTQEDGKGKPTPTPHAVPKDVPTHEDDKDKQSGLIRSVTALFQGLITENICKFFGIHRIYRMKLHHVRCLEILVCMCKVLTTKKMKNCDIKQKEFVETAIFQAAERGLVEFLTGIFRVNPDLATIKNEKGRNIFQVAVKCRQAKVYRLCLGGLFSSPAYKHTTCKCLVSQLLISFLQKLLWLLPKSRSSRTPAFKSQKPEITVADVTVD